MKSETDIGTNLTGIGTSPIRSKEMIDAALQTPASPPANGNTAAAMRGAYVQDAGPVGTMPVPTSLKGVAGAAVGVLKGEKATVLLDRLGERLAFEREGVRLYEAFITKVRAAAPAKSGPTVTDLTRIRDQELAHFEMVHRAIKTLGADPTVETPSADITGVLSTGLPLVIHDPRTSVTQCLQALLVAELADNDGWQLLIDLAADMGHADIANELRQALAQERQHLTDVRGWLTQAVRSDAGA